MPLVADETSRCRVIFALAVALLFAGVEVAAQQRGLFQALEPVAANTHDEESGRAAPSTTRIPTRGGETVRHREARIDFARLAAVKASIESGKDASLELNLFDDIAFKGINLRTARTSSGGFSLTGHLDRVPFGTVVLVVNGEIVKGTIRTPFTTYTVDEKDGVCHIREVDPSSLPPLGEPLRPPQSMSSPSNGTGYRRTPLSGAGVVDDEDTPVIDVLVVYTPAVTEALGGVLAVNAEVEMFVAETNRAYQDSNVAQEIFLTRVVEVDYVEVGNSGIDLNRLRDPDDGHMDIVHELREKTGSDLVHLITESGTVCGIAYLMVNPVPWFQNFGFGLTIRNCGGRTVAHELGHNMGLRHDRYVDSSDTPYPYSHGYVNQAAFEEGAAASTRWRTIMAYNDQCSEAGFTCTELLRFSNAEQAYEGDPLGVAEGNDAADARRSLNATRQLVADFRAAGPDLVPGLVILQRAWQPGQVVTILGAVTNEGRIESGETQATLYRSSDPNITDDDTEVASFDVRPLGGKELADDLVHVGTAPAAGGYYYGVCVDAVEGETDTANCSPGTYVSVGPTVSVADAETPEGEPVLFAVSLSQARDAPVDVQWELVRETAVAGIDYVAAVDTLTIPANETRASISVDTIDDDVPEADDAFTIRLVGTTPAPPDGVVLSVDGTQATGTIRNDDGDLRFSDAQLRAAVLRALNKPGDGDFTIEELAALRVLDANSTGDEKIDDLTGLEAATGLETLLLFDNAVVDLSPLGHLGSLTELFLDRNGFETLEGLAPLTTLTTLSLTGNPVEDLSPLAGLTALNRLWLDETGVMELEPLTGLTALHMLILQCADRDDVEGRADCESESITDISPLAGLTNLTDLNLNFHNVVDISPLGESTRLNVLALWGNEIEDLEPLRALEDLFWMDLDDNEITDIEPLGGLTNLRALHLNGNQVQNLAPLSGLENLDTLGLNANGVTDIAVLAGLRDLRLLWLGENQISDLSPLKELDQLELLDLGANDIANISTLADLFRLRELHLQNNRIRDISPLANLRRLGYVDLSNNDIRDIEPLVSNSRLRDGDAVLIQGNPLNENSYGVHVPALLEREVDLTYIGVSVAAGSAVEGGEMEFVVRVSPEADEGVTVNWAVSEGSATAGDDYPMGQSDGVTVAAGETEAVFSVSTTRDAERERHELFEVRLTEGVAFPDGVGLAGSLEEDGNELRATALGLIVDPEGPVEDAPLFASASDETRQGFLRVINHGERNVVHIVAADDAGNRRTTTLAMDAGETVHFNSNDLENGNARKGLSRGIGEGEVDWRLELSGNDVDVLTYMRTNDGFLTSLHDVVPGGTDGYSVPIFNPGRNANQQSLLRLINPGDADAEVAITGIDDSGSSSGEASLTLAAGGARTISAADLENGVNLRGELGSGSGKWRLAVASDQPIRVSSLMQTPTGHLTNLSTSPDNTELVGGDTAHHVHLFPSASDPKQRQGFVRVVNRGEAGSIEIRAFDGTEHEYETVTLSIDANETVHFNSNDLEDGNTGKGLSGNTGAGEGDWRLELTSALDLDVLAYIRRTEDGFLTSMHDTVPSVGGVHRVPIFNPGSNRNQVSRLLLINPGEEAVEVRITGVDDLGRQSSGSVSLSVPAGEVRTVSALALEAGGDELRGALGDGVGKWSLDVNSDGPIRVMNLLESPTGHLTNLSTMP